MADSRSALRHLAERLREAPEVAELCELHELALEMIEGSEEPKVLLNRALEEYERRLEALPASALEADEGESPETVPKLLTLMLFARQAAALKVRVENTLEARRKFEEQRRLARLEGVLETVSALSHRINNPLTALIGRAQLLQHTARPDPEVARAAAVIEDSAKRIADLVRELAVVVKSREERAIARFLDPDAPDGRED